VNQATENSVAAKIVIAAATAQTNIMSPESMTNLPSKSLGNLADAAQKRFDPRQWMRQRY
jgi:hypothetical protein